MNRRIRPWLSSLILLAVILAPALANSSAAFEQDEQAALQAISEGKFVRAREMAETILARAPNSVPALFAKGIALREAEGNIPLALRHFRNALDLIEKRKASPLPQPERWRRELLLQVLFCLSDLGQAEEQLKVNAILREEFDTPTISLDVWPLMKLGRITEAREAAARAIATGDKIEEMSARTGLCAIDHYPACMELVQRVRENQLEMGNPLRNGASSALEAGRFEEAEQLLLESVQYPDETINPWRDLAELYLIEGRFGEAVDAGKNMFRFARSLPIRQQQHSGAEDRRVAAQLLLLVGRTSEALNHTTEALSAPDRAGHWSGSSAELQAQAALLNRAAHRSAAEEEREIAALVSWKDAPFHRMAALQHDIAGWLSGRRVLPLLQAGGLRQRTSNRMNRPGLDAPPWLYPDAVSLFGTGPSLALIESNRRLPPDPAEPTPREVLESERLALETEALCTAGSWDACWEKGQAALQLLPPAQALLRVRVGLRLAQAALGRGRSAEAWPLFTAALERDAGALRRLRIALPVEAAFDQSTAGKAVQLLLATPRFSHQIGSPFALVAQGAEVCLRDAKGNNVTCAADPGPQKAAARETPTGAAAGSPGRRALKAIDPGTLDDPAARIALVLLRKAFAPRIDLSQGDLASLDGSPINQRGVGAEELEDLVDRP